MTARPSRTLLRRGAVQSPAHPLATAMLVVDGEIVWIGDESGADGHLDEADTVVDLHGRLVTPGFVDAHVHLAATGFALATVDLGAAVSLADALDRLAAAAASQPHDLLLAHGWDETTWPESRPMTLTEVDSAVGTTVAYLSRVDSHSAVVSSALLDLSPGISSLDGWHDDGRVERDAHHAAREVTHRLSTPDQRAAAILAALRHAASRGIASVHELNAPHIAPFADFATIRDLRARHPLPDVACYWGARLADADGLAQVPDDDWLLGFAGDLCVDGALGSRTACLHEPYRDAATSGHLYLGAAEIRDQVVECTERGKQAGFHVIGDRALHEVAEGLRQAAEQVGTEAIVAARHRLEHVEMPDPESIALLAELGVVASVQPPFDAAWGGTDGMYSRRLGPDRAAPMNPLASMARAGVVLAFGSDSPVTALDPWGGVRAAVRHHNEHERLSPAAAFEAHTRGGHRARRDDVSGLLRAGAAATYAVWEVAGPLLADGLPELEPDQPSPTCMETVVAGRVVYTAEEEA